MTPERLLRDFKLFCFVSIFYLLVLAIICFFKVRAARKGQSGPFDLVAELKAVFANRNFTWLYSALYVFSLMYAVKFVVFRILLMFVYLAFVIKLVKADLASRDQ